MKYEKILKKVLKRIVPSKEEEIELKKVIEEVEEEIKKRKPKETEVMLVGSVAKGTYLKNALDVDFFILFPQKYKKDEMAEIVINIGKEILHEWEVQYAEHPYIRGKYKGYEIDVVPCYKIKDASHKISAVDRTPFHTEYIKKNLKEEMKNEVRLLKQFLKGIGCYGAEAKVEGFSGYLAELLILKYESFLNVLEESQKWKGKTILYISRNHKKFDEDFVFIDPVDPTRNVAAALSKEKLNFFIFAAREFLKNPKIEFFFPNEPKQLDMAEIEQKLKNFVGILFKKPNLPDDVLYPQLKKAAGSIENLFLKNDFKVLRKVWYANDEAFVAIELEKKEIDEIKIHMGPPLYEKKHVKSFIKKWSSNERAIDKPFIKNGRVWVKLKREYNNAIDLLKNSLKEINLGKNLNQIKEKIKICNGKKLAKFRSFWSEFFCNKYPWER